MPTSASGGTLRFTDFELDLGAYQLRRKGRVVHLERQPMDLLILLVERRGQLVSRAEIVERLWGKDVFVDVETGVHTAVRKIRQALGDSTSTPGFVETVPGKGYRFVAQVEVVEREDSSRVTAVDLSDQESIHSAVAVPALVAPDTATISHPSSKKPVRVVMGLMVVAIATSFAAWAWLDAGGSASRVTLAVLPFHISGVIPSATIWRRASPRRPSRRLPRSTSSA